jgi:hypothetical protein
MASSEWRHTLQTLLLHGIRTITTQGVRKLAACTRLRALDIHAAPLAQFPSDAALFKAIPSLEELIQL